jgi:hypothetical protein
MHMSDWIDLLQWPAMAASLIAAYLVASHGTGKRNAGFWIFLLSNALWVIWGWHTGSYALIALQFGLAALNFRGVSKTSTSPRAERA